MSADERNAVEQRWGATVANKLDDLLIARAAAELAGEAVPQPVPILIHLPRLFRGDESLDESRSREDIIRELEEFAGNRQRPVLEAIARITGGQESITNRIPLINVIVANLTLEQARQLAALGEVEKLEADKAILPELNVSVPAIEAVGLTTQSIVALDGRGVQVAVLGGEVDNAHPDLTGRVVHRRNYTEEEFGNPTKHETLVAGIIAGDGSASSGQYRGVAPGATILSYKLGMTGLDPGYLKAQAILDAARDGAHVINCSWRVVEGTPRDGTCAWCKAVDAATQLGAVVVKSAGNTGPGSGTTTCPGNAFSVIAVGATSNDGTRMARSNTGTEFSSCGPTADGRSKPELVAPGEDIQGANVDGGYTSDEYADGTSFAAPHIAGVAALLIQAFPNIRPAIVRQALMESAKELAGIPKGKQGAGLVRAKAALERAGQLLGELPPTPNPERPAIEFESIPAFRLQTGVNEYYAVELATEPALFRERDRHREFHSQPQNPNFFASWAESSVPPLPRAVSRTALYQLPAEAWLALRGMPRLYYRVLTSVAAETWENVQYSVSDEEAESAPFIQPSQLREGPESGERNGTASSVHQAIIPLQHDLQQVTEQLRPSDKLWYLVAVNPAVRTELRDVITLPTLKKMSYKLSKEDRLRLVEQALLLLEQNYVHLPLKKAMHAVDPVQRLRVLQQRIVQTPADRLPGDLDFHYIMIEIFTSVRDLHTNYVLPEPYNQLTAFVPFLIESFVENGNRRYLVSYLVEGFEAPPFGIGAEILYWNGIPIDRAVEVNADRFSGSNMDARLARGIAMMTVRPLALALPPDEEWVVIGYQTPDGMEHELRVDWLVFNPTSRAEVEKTSMIKEHSTVLGIDMELDLVNRARKYLFAPHVVEIEKTLSRTEAVEPEGLESRFPSVLEARLVDTVHGECGYVRIWSFYESDIDAFVEEFIRLVEQLPQKGLIIDVRGNQGGVIMAAEGLLQLLTSRSIEPQRFQFLNSPLNLELCRRHAPSKIAEFDLDLSPWIESIEQSVQTGEIYSRGFSLTPSDVANAIGQRYHGPVVLITDALCYSATDLFAAGFQDHNIGPVLGVDGNTGAGGANVWTHDLLWTLFEQPTPAARSPYAVLPNGAAIRVGMRRSLRVGKRADTPLEDLGVVPDFRHDMTRNDLLHKNVDLISHAVEILLVELSPTPNPERPTIEFESIPAFRLQTGVNEYYAVELATEPALFRERDRHREFHSQPQNPNFFASWAESSVPPLPRAVSRTALYQLPAEAWLALRGMPRLYYRVLTSVAAETWENVQYSVSDEEAESAPFIQPSQLREGPESG